MNELNERKRALIVIGSALSLAFIAIVFQLPLFPFSNFPMYACLKPAQEIGPESLSMDLKSLWCKQQVYLIVGVTHDQMERPLPYNRWFPLGRDQFWWRNFARGMDQAGSVKILASLGRRFHAKLGADLSALRLYRYDIPFYDWLEHVKEGEPFYFRSRKLIGEFKFETL